MDRQKINGWAISRRQRDTPDHSPSLDGHRSGVSRFKSASAGEIRESGKPNDIPGTSKMSLESAMNYSLSERACLDSTEESTPLSMVQQTASAQAPWRGYQPLINQLIMALRKAEPLEAILQQAVEGLGRTLAADRVMVLLLQYDNPLSENSAWTQLPQIKISLTCEWMQQGLSAVAVNECSDFWISECRLCQQALANAPESLVFSQIDMSTLRFIHANAEGNEDLRLASFLQWETFPALLSVPLITAASLTPMQSTVLGFLVLQYRQPHTWQPSEVELAELIATQLSNAVIQTQTLRQVQSLVEERTAQLQQSLEVQAKLYEQTRRHIEQLRHLNQLKDEFISTVNHELRTPLTIMALAIRMLRQADLAEANREKYLSILEQQCSKETSLVNDLLALQKLESRQLPLQSQQIDLKELIHELAQSFQEKWQAKHLAIALELPKRSLKLHSDFESLRRILEELFLNAGKYSNPETTITLKVSYQAQPQSSHIVLKLSNIGMGIPQAELPYIFEKFRRGQGITQQASIPGTGLGLALVKGLVQHLEGTITVSSQPLCVAEPLQAWLTCFTLTLPQFQGIEPA